MLVGSSPGSTANLVSRGPRHGLFGAAASQARPWTSDAWHHSCSSAARRRGNRGSRPRWMRCGGRVSAGRRWGCRGTQRRNAGGVADVEPGAHRDARPWSVQRRLELRGAARGWCPQGVRPSMRRFTPPSGGSSTMVSTARSGLPSERTWGAVGRRMHDDHHRGDAVRPALPYRAHPRAGARLA